VGKKARNNFSINTRLVRAKNVGKKIVSIGCEKFFIYSHEFREQKMGGKKRETIFPEKTPIVPAKNVGKKIV